MKDIYVEEMALRKWLFSKVREVCDRFGFREAYPVDVENFETLAAKGGEDIDQEIYVFEDKAGRKLGLRFDLTLGLARMIASGKFPYPQKIYCVGQMWRYDAPQFGRYRSFWQWDIEIFGAEDSRADAEVIACSAEILKSLGLRDFVIAINSRKLVEGILAAQGITRKGDVENAMRAVDKMAKLSRKELIEEFDKYGFEKSQAEKVLGALAPSGEPEKILAILETELKDTKQASAGLRELREVVEALRPYGVLENCKVDLSIVRGLAYYTGVVFEIYDPKNRDIGALAAGGRFDKLLGIYGKAAPSTGAAGGVERLLLALEENNIEPKVKIGPSVFVAAVEDEQRDKAAELARVLRDRGISADVDLAQRKLGAQLEYAAKINASYAIIVGQKELEEKAFTVRDLSSGKQEKLPLDEILARLRKNI